jgi:CRISPR/Cas system-associated exonuclease Cas4 (RecB family)
MPLPPEFSFSQHNLQDFIDCPRKFYLKYIQNLIWPAIQSEPVLELERQIELGSKFHRTIHQFYLGIDSATLENQCDDLELKIWLRNFLNTPKLRDFKTCFPETTLTSSLQGFRIIAKFDLIAVTNEAEIQILDWKTSRRKPLRSALQQRMQTRLYPFVLCNSLHTLLPGFDFQPNRLSMTYWFTDFPAEEEHFDYGQIQLDNDRSYLSSLIATINSSEVDDFKKTSNEKMCRFCVYRSFCERGQAAGDWKDLEDVESVDDLSALSFLDAGEIPF